eukprot:gb/GECG01000485.1/.p1 GENE.gb/GECG01000485.1/~~gb/GECG01000485.1/.p1  ORF type:complete len:271 (+),score=22.58 gb/GECG01000485.1/:1-813(+)
MMSVQRRIASRLARSLPHASALMTPCMRTMAHRGISATAAKQGIFAAHRNDDPTNTEDHHFDFTPENYEVVETILAKYPENYKRAAIIPLLDLAQRQCGNFLPVAAMKKVARIVGVTDGEVMEVSTFYTMFNRERVGKYFIQLCGTTPCMVNGSEEIKSTIEKHLGIKCGDTTKDGLFTLLEVECLGACVNAPMIQINDDYYECLTPETTRQLLDECRKSGPPTLNKYGRYVAKDFLFTLLVTIGISSLLQFCNEWTVHLRRSKRENHPA